MGSWNETCGLTHLTITDNEPTVLFVLRAKPAARLVTTGPLSGDWYKPVAAPFYGVYNSYGTIDPDPAREQYHLSIMKALRASESTVTEFLDNLERGNSSLDSGQVQYTQMLVRQVALGICLDVTGDMDHFVFRDGALVPTTMREHYRTALTKARDSFAVLHDASRLSSDLPIAEAAALAEEFTRDGIDPYTVFLSPHFATDEMLDGVFVSLLTDTSLYLMRKAWSPSVVRTQHEELALTAALAQYSLESLRSRTEALR